MVKSVSYMTSWDENGLDSQLFNLQSVYKLITFWYKADDCYVICKLQELD